MTTCPNCGHCFVDERSVKGGKASRRVGDPEAFKTLNASRSSDDRAAAARRGHMKRAARAAVIAHADTCPYDTYDLCDRVKKDRILSAGQLRWLEKIESGYVPK